MDGKWSIDETKRLFDLAYQSVEKGDSLATAFSQVSQECGKSLNSVRSYYYSQLRLFEMMPLIAKQLGIRTLTARRESFTLFTREEIDSLVESVLVGKANGKSVRAVITSLAGGDEKKALRLQNKYRSTVACHRDRVQRVTSRLLAEKKPYYDPYLKRVVTDKGDDDNLARLAGYIGTLDSDKMVDVVKILLGR